MNAVTVKVLEANEKCRESGNLYTGESAPVKTVSFSLEVLEGEGMVYVGYTSFVAEQGAIVHIDVDGVDSIAHAMWLLQGKVTTVNVEPVEKTELTTWTGEGWNGYYGTDKADITVSFDSEEDAMEWREKGYGKRYLTKDVKIIFSDVVFIDDKKPVIIANAFSLNMMQEANGLLRFTELDANEVSVAAKASGFRSIVGHADTAAVFSSELGIDIPCVRETFVLQPGDSLIVGQYSGPRLEEGAKVLPEGAKIRWLQVDYIDE